MNEKITPTRQSSLVANSRKTSAPGRPTGRVSKRDWLDKGLEVLTSGGVDAVRVSELAKELSISKSGFYWHFKNRADLLEAMKIHWVDEFSRRFIRSVQSDEHPVRERLVSLVQTIRASDSSKLDLAFTSWAQTDPSVRDLVARVWDLRIAFVKDLLSSTGASDAELASRARLFVVYFSWSEVVFEPTMQRFADEDLDMIIDIIVGAKRG